MFNSEQVSSFERDKLLKVDQAIEENPYLCIEFLQLVEVEVTFLRWLDHIVHLAQQINEKNLLVIQVLKPVNLLLVEVLHLMWCDDLVVIQIDNGEPVAQTSRRGLILF